MLHNPNSRIVPISECQETTVPKTAEFVAPTSLLSVFLLRTQGVLEVVAVDAEPVGGVVRSLLRRFLLDFSGLGLLRGSLRDFIVVVIRISTRSLLGRRFRGRRSHFRSSCFR